MSTFRERLEQWKAGSLTLEEEAAVREEIDKAEAIDEYLSERFDELLPMPEDSEDSAAGKRIARTVSLRLWRTILLILLLLSLAVGAVVIGCDLYYYNPNKGIQPHFGGDGQLTIDMLAFTELHSAGYSFSQAEAYRDGPGSYQVYLSHYSLTSGTQQSVATRIVRGRVPGNTERGREDYWHFPMGNAFGYRQGVMLNMDENGNESRNPDSADTQNVFDELQKLPSSSRVSVYVSFPQDLSMEQFVSLYEKWDDRLSFLYAAVWGRTPPFNTTIGFAPDSGGSVLENLPEEYPYFQLLGLRDELKENRAEIWEQHFRSLVDYLANRPDFIATMIGVNGIDAAYYKDVQRYIDENGVKLYGTLIQGSTEDILAYLEEEPFYDLYVDHVRLSILGKG